MLSLSLTELAFYLFAFVTVAAGALVISAKNPVHSVLWLILAFFSSAGLFVLMGAEFLAMLLVIVYVGAVAVLFLFVVMMLDINFVELRQGFLQYLPIGALIGAILAIELVVLGSAWHFGPDVASNIAAQAPAATEVENTKALGQIIYTDYIFIFQTAGLILLVAMIGAIVLTHRTRPGVKRQNIAEQVARRPEDAFELVDVEVGKGVPMPTKKG
ncbi:MULTISPECIES: NADH-quinone oxidoreductase subunit J [Kordiimonas]|uniref:NADH-quinone oxidoreductase subunit J n=1 Tax=Kordiimonas TaxID=288021 RepID=UPI001FF1FD45|nr:MULTISPECIES: NADH-quinone oxidoreductase subunit J [Kordiimonas]MCK0070995.1 NADH-quinone oxidoreductase subunit J [Kordiimonas laminariae]UTW57501.1 NADH-quinone oxidoreductase subunit J [Kordiimonas sp. SCSIO 12603]